MQRLMIDSPINYKVEKTDDGTEYQVLLIWEESLQSCVISYLVNVTYKDKAGETNSTIQTNYFLPPNLNRGREFIVSVAGVNGDVTGPYSPELCIEIEGKKSVYFDYTVIMINPVPGNVTVTMNNSLLRTSNGHLLVVTMLRYILIHIWSCAGKIFWRL